MSNEPADEMPEIADAVVKDYDVVDKFDYDVSFNLAFIGVGQGGGKIAETFFKLGYRRVAAVNTTHTDLETISDEISKLDLNYGGAGKDPEQGARAVRGQEEAIYEQMTRAFGKGADYIFVCAGLGGGTGSGAAPPIIAIAKRFMEETGGQPSRVGAILSLPHQAEGPTPSKNAVRAFEKIYGMGVTPLFIIDNKRIGEMFRAGVTEHFGLANEQVARHLHLFNRLAAQRSTITTFDRADFATLLDAGICAFGASTLAKYDSPADFGEAIRKHLRESVLVEVDFSKGTRAGCLFMGGPKQLSEIPMDFFDGGFSMLNRLLAPQNMVHRGIYVGKPKQTDLRCYTLLSGLPVPHERLKRLAVAGFIDNDESVARFLGVE